MITSRKVFGVGSEADTALFDLGITPIEKKAEDVVIPKKKEEEDTIVPAGIKPEGANGLLSKEQLATYKKNKGFLSNRSAEAPDLFKGVKNDTSQDTVYKPVATKGSTTRSYSKAVPLQGNVAGGDKHAKYSYSDGVNDKDLRTLIMRKYKDAGGTMSGLFGGTVANPTLMARIRRDSVDLVSRVRSGAKGNQVTNPAVVKKVQGELGLHNANATGVSNTKRTLDVLRELTPAGKANPANVALDATESIMAPSVGVAMTNQASDNKQLLSLVANTVDPNKKYTIQEALAFGKTNHYIPDNMAIADEGSLTSADKTALNSYRNEYNILQGDNSADLTEGVIRQNNPWYNNGTLTSRQYLESGGYGNTLTSSLFQAGAGMIPFVDGSYNAFAKPEGELAEQLDAINKPKTQTKYTQAVARQDNLDKIKKRADNLMLTGSMSEEQATQQALSEAGVNGDGSRTAMGILKDFGSAFMKHPLLYGAGAYMLYQIFKPDTPAYYGGPMSAPYYPGAPIGQGGGGLMSALGPALLAAGGLYAYNKYNSTTSNKPVDVKKKEKTTDSTEVVSLDKLNNNAAKQQATQVT